MLAKHRQYIGKRYVEISKVAQEEVQWHLRSANFDGNSYSSDIFESLSDQYQHRNYQNNNNQNNLHFLAHVPQNVTECQNSAGCSPCDRPLHSRELPVSDPVLDAGRS